MNLIARRSRRSGFSLIEVIIGVGLLSVIALTIVGMFIQGRKGVQSGKNTTGGLAIAQHVAENLDSLNYEALWQSWSIAAGNTIAATNTRATIEIARNGGVWSLRFIATPTPGYSGEKAASGFTTIASSTLIEPVKSWATQWATELDTLPEARIEVQLTPCFDMNDDGTAEPANALQPYVARFSGASFIRMEITVRWTEGGGTRFLTIPQVRTLNEI